MTEEVVKSNGQPVSATESNPAYPSLADQVEVVVRMEKVDKLRLLWNRRGLVLRWTFIGFVLSTIVALLISNQYESTTNLMPPDQMNSGTGLAMLAATASDKIGSGLGAISGDLLGLKSTSALFVEILQGRTVEDDIVNKFDLRKSYSDRYIDDARNELRRNTDISEDRRSGIITIRVTDKSPERAAAMAQEYVTELNRVVVDVNTSSAHRERVFLEDRLARVRQDLENSEKEFSEFASKNTALDIPAQGHAMIEAAATLEGQLAAALTELESMKQVYANGNVRVRAMEARVAEIRRQLQKLGGDPDRTTSSITQADQSLYPSIRELPLLGVNYADLYRNTKIQEAIFETLTQQYEIAKVEEAKETPTVKVVDPPEVPEKKSFPHRSLIVFEGTIVSMSFVVLWILVSASWIDIDPQDPRKMLASEIYVDSKAHLAWAIPNGASDRTIGSRAWSRLHKPVESLDKHN
jgi:uncharacterized protein involved in exopolysaccharide biosynthesis